MEAGGLMAVVEPEGEPEVEVTVAVIEGCEGVSSPVTASVFRIEIERGQRVSEGQKLIVLDAMKTEILVTAHVDGIVEEIHCAQAALVQGVQGGQLLISVRPTGA